MRDLGSKNGSEKQALAPSVSAALSSLECIYLDWSAAENGEPEPRE
jgi:hypothetical protein